MQNGIPRTLGEAIPLYYAEIDSIRSEQAVNIRRETDSALARYLAPALGFKRTNYSARMTKIEQKSSLAFVSKLLLKRTPEMISLVEQEFEHQNTSKASRYTYGARIRQFTSFLEKQVWYPGNRTTNEFRSECALPMPYRFGRTSSTVVMPERKNVAYGLRPEEITPSLQKEFDQFYLYCCGTYYPGRVIKPCSADTQTTATYIFQIKTMLGWWLHYYRPELTIEQLSLTLLVPLLTEEALEELTSRERKRQWRQLKQEIETWINRYFQFMQDELGSYSPGTRVGRIMAVLKIAMFVYTDEVDSQSEYAAIPIIGALRDLKSSWNERREEWRRNNKYAADQSKKWPETGPHETALAVIRRDVVEPIRLRCRPRNSSGYLHSPRPQARFLAIYLIWFELAYEPPRRQQEFRTRQLTRACPIDRPESVPRSGLYHPLPPIKARKRGSNGDIIDNFLYRTYSCSQSG
ncbi:MAG: hypothetical protein F6K04_01160 [Leptolyngbya sp. SIO4C5]|nr:hypothetical protein [Leptolyngbya sp. SIO4C5]